MPRGPSFPLLLACCLVLGWGPRSRAQAPIDDETTRHLAAMKERLEDSSLDLTLREEMALEMAGTLDRAARGEPSLEGKLARWDAAVALLDEFAARHSDLSKKREIGLQAAVYRWAEARSWHDRRELHPRDDRAPVEEAKALDDSIARLRLIVGGDPSPLTDNIRFRLAWALTDRAALETEGSPTAPLRRDEALKLLGTAPSEPSLIGFQALLKAELLRVAGKLDEAGVNVAAAARAPSPPPDAEILDVLIPILLSKRAHAEARKALDAMKVPDAARGLFHLRIDLDDWKAAPADPGDEARRREVERTLLKRIEELREGGRAEYRLALSELAASGIDFGESAPPGLWDAVAQGWDVRGEPVRAAAASEKAAACAAKAGLATEATASRLRAAGFLFQASRLDDAAGLLEKIVGDPEAGPSRPRASLLLALARGRAADADAGGPATRAYEEALERHLREFPDDPTAVEARWMLGTLEQSRGRRDRALELWKSVPLESPRWIQARIAACDALRDELEDRVAAEEREGLQAAFDAAESFVDESLNLARSRPESDLADLLIAQARLNLVPIVGRPMIARDAAERCLTMNITTAQRYRAKLARMTAMAAQGRYVEAEREAQQHPSWADPSELGTLLTAIRQIDLAAAASESDLPQRRFGQVTRVLLQPLLQEQSLPNELRNELTFRLARALLFQGDPRTAQATLQNWSPSTGKADDRFLRDLADAYARLDANELAIDVQRLRIKKLTAGSQPWFDARYGLALAYFRLGRRGDAQQLIEATAILHPELGGGRLREKFIRLRQRLGSPR